MSSAVSAYPSTEHSPSANKSTALSRDQVRVLLESVDFSVERNATVVVRKTGRRIPVVRRYRRDHLRSALLGMWKASTQPCGREIRLFVSVEQFAEGASRCERAMRYILRELESPEIGVLELRHRANSVRRPATYALNLERLEKFRSRRKSSRPVEMPKKEATNSAPVERVAPSDPVGQRQQPKLSKPEAVKFLAEMLSLMKGCTYHVEAVGGYGYELKPGDPRYRPKMPWRAALTAVCERWKRTPESVTEALKFWGYEVESEEIPP